MATRRTFLGITTGMAVALSIVQSGLSANGTTGAGGWANAQPQPEAPPPPLPTASVTISVYRSTLPVAPEPIAFEVTGWDGFDTTGPAEGETFDPRLHDLVYFWDFGDTGSVYTAPVNVPAAFKNRNVGYGFRVSHTYRTAGSPTISVLVVEPSSGKYATASVTLNSTGDLAPIQAEDAYFTGATTIWMDTAGNTTGMPAGATLVTSIASLFTTLASRSTEKLRVIMRSGQTFASPSTTTGGSVFLPTAYFRASDMSGTRPIISYSGSGYMWQLNRGDLRQGTEVWRFAHVEFQGANDLEAGTKPNAALYALFFVSGDTDTGEGRSGPRYFEFDDCRGGNADGIYYHSGLSGRGGHGPRVTFNDCHFENCDFFVYGEFDWLHTTGCRHTHDTNNLCGGFKADQNNEHGGSIRTFVAYNGVIDGCDYMVRGGWVTRDPVNNTIVQNCAIRWNSNSEASRLNMRRCVLEGGAPTVSLSDANVGSPVVGVNYAVGECLFLGSWSTDVFVTLDKGGTTIENCIGILPPVEGTGVSRTPGSFLQMTTVAAGSTGTDERVMIRNCSVVVEANTADFSSFAAPDWVGYWDTTTQAQFPNVQTANNVYHAPNLNTPVLASPALAKATPFGAAQNPGMRTSWVGHNVSLGSIAPGGTVTSTYRSGYSGSDFGNFPWKLLWSYVDPGDGKTKTATEPEGGTTFSITRRASDYDIINNTALTITPVTIFYDRRNGGVPEAMRTAYKTDPNAMALWHPVSAPGSAPSGVTMIDLLGRIRPGTLHPNAAAGTPSAGALEPV